MNNKEREDLIEKIKREVDSGYHNRPDYPPYALAEEPNEDEEDA